MIFAFMMFLSFGFSLIAHAWWEQEAQIEQTPTRVTATVENNRSRSIFCEGRVFGRTQIGSVLNNWGQTTIRAGQSVQLSVETRDNNPFIQGWADIRCR